MTAYTPRRGRKSGGFQPCTPSIPGLNAEGWNEKPQDGGDHSNRSNPSNPYFHRKGWDFAPPSIFARAGWKGWNVGVVA